MHQKPSVALPVSPFMVFISAAIFGYFGFLYPVNWSTPGVDGQVVLFRVTLGWTLKVSAVAFGITGIVVIVNAMIGNLLYSIIGLISAVLFLLIAMMDLADQQHGIFVGAPFILILFAAWNGYGSFAGLCTVFTSRDDSASFGPPPP